ncbi:MAG: RsmD family RNA methyltransferase [Candidatus Eisenbacteria bacterium]
MTNWTETLWTLAQRRRLALPPPNHPEPLAALDYDAELALKREAIAAFWRAAELPGAPDPVVAARAPRAYRTTTKRRADFRGSDLRLVFPGAPPSRVDSVAPSVLDLPEHAAVYAFLVDRLRRPPARPLAAALNWAIVRGSAPALAVILNLRRFDAPAVRAAKSLAQAIESESALGVRSAFLYLDPSSSDYYLEARRPGPGILSFKRLFGPDWLEVDVDGTRLRFPPAVFSQGNAAMLPVMVETSRALLAPVEGRSLLDLYCGYGLFSLTAGRDAAHVVGADFDRAAIEAARSNAEHLKMAGRMRFVAARIDGAFVADRLRPHAGVTGDAEEIVLLDPPRQGTAPGVVPAIAERGPARVAHVCCGTDEIPRESAAWSRAGYRLRRAVPLDLFPGTAGLETFLLFEPE